MVSCFVFVSSSPPFLFSTFLCFFVFLAVAGPAFRELVDLFAKMPSEKFLALLVKSRAPGASTIIVDDSEEKGPEIGSKDVASTVEAIGVGESNAALVRDREKKRHRDGGTSRGHHSKKFKEPVSCLKSENLSLSAKVGSLSCERVTVGASSEPELSGSGLVLCKGYADKVQLR